MHIAIAFSNPPYGCNHHQERITAMFNPEKLLGGLLRGSSRGGIGTGTKAAIGMGLLGVAMEAAEHFMNQSKNPPGKTGPPPGGPTASAGTGAPPPPPPPGSGAATAPPPPPGTQAVTGPPPAPEAAPAPPAGSVAANNRAVLLIRAMIAAANADGVIDAAERDKILKKLERIGLSDEERSFIVKELLAPASQEEILAEVDDPKLGQQVYAVSLMAIEVDTPSEQQYMHTLAQGLGLNDSVVAAICEKLGVGVP
jgi:hypothetical protein